MIVNRRLRQFISHLLRWHLSCRFYVVEGTFKFEDYIDEQFQTYMVNLGKFFPKNIYDEIWKTFIDYLKDNNEWHEEFFKC